MRISNVFSEELVNLECKGGDYASSPESNFSPEEKAGQKKSFRQARKTRKRKKAEQLLSKSLVRKEKPKMPFHPPVSPGPTKETRAKLQPDPLSRLYKMGTLTRDNMAAAQKIRRAFELITVGATVRMTGYLDVIVQTSRCGDNYESDHEVMLKRRYADWVDDMTAQRLPVGPIFDMVIEEMSLGAVDRKWRRRKGWACAHLKRALELYLYPDFEGKSDE